MYTNHDDNMVHVKWVYLDCKPTGSVYLPRASVFTFLGGTNRLLRNYVLYASTVSITYWIPINNRINIHGNIFVVITDRYCLVEPDV